MNILSKLIKPVHAHCDLFCGVYDPAQARIEAQSVYNAVKKYHDSNDEHFKARCILIKEERAQLAKEHLWVLWSDYFKPEHLKSNPQLHDVFWKATKACSDAKQSLELDTAQALLDAVDAVGELFAGTKDGYDYKAVVKNLS